LKTAGYLIPEKDENGETVYRRRSDLRRAQLEAEAKALETLRASAPDSIRVESNGGPLPRSSGGFWSPESLGGEAVTGLIRAGVFEDEARRRVTLALEKFKTAGRTPRSSHELLQAAGGCI